LVPTVPPPPTPRHAPRFGVASDGIRNNVPLGLPRLRINETATAAPYSRPVVLAYGVALTGAALAFVLQ
jgi:hypothetical protein